MTCMQDREIVIGVCGGVSAYKTAALTSSLVQSGARVTVVLTESAKKFIGAATFEALTGRPVYSDLFEPKEHFIGEHIGLARRAELLVIAPATAQTIARLAHGFADDLLTTLALARTCPMLLAPAMNAEMWSKPAVQRNVSQLREDGAHFAEPGEGWLSCRVQGAGRMAEPMEIQARIADLLAEPR